MEQNSLLEKQIEKVKQIQLLIEEIKKCQSEKVIINYKKVTQIEYKPLSKWKKQTFITLQLKTNNITPALSNLTLSKKSLNFSSEYDYLLYKKGDLFQGLSILLQQNQDQQESKKTPDMTQSQNLKQSQFIKQVNIPKPTNLNFKSKIIDFVRIPNTSNYKQFIIDYYEFMDKQKILDFYINIQFILIVVDGKNDENITKLFDKFYNYDNFKIIKLESQQQQQNFKELQEIKIIDYISQQPYRLIIDQRSLIYYAGPSPVDLKDKQLKKFFESEKKSMMDIQEYKKQRKFMIDAFLNKMINEKVSLKGSLTYSITKNSFATIDNQQSSEISNKYDRALIEVTARDKSEGVINTIYWYLKKQFGPEKLRQKNPNLIVFEPHFDYLRNLFISYQFKDIQLCKSKKIVFQMYLKNTEKPYYEFLIKNKLCQYKSLNKTEQKKDPQQNDGKQEQSDHNQELNDINKIIEVNQELNNYQKECKTNKITTKNIKKLLLNGFTMKYLPGSKFKGFKNLFYQYYKSPVNHQYTSNTITHKNDVLVILFITMNYQKMQNQTIIQLDRLNNIYQRTRNCWEAQQEQQQQPQSQQLILLQNSEQKQQIQEDIDKQQSSQKSKIPLRIIAVDFSSTQSSKSEIWEKLIKSQNWKQDIYQITQEQYKKILVYQYGIIQQPHILIINKRGEIYKNCAISLKDSQDCFKFQNMLMKLINQKLDNQNNKESEKDVEIDFDNDIVKDQNQNEANDQNAEQSKKFKQILEIFSKAETEKDGIIKKYLEIKNLSNHFFNLTLEKQQIYDYLGTLKKTIYKTPRLTLVARDDDKQYFNGLVEQIQKVDEKVKPNQLYMKTNQVLIQGDLQEHKVDSIVVDDLPFCGVCKIKKIDNYPRFYSYINQIWVCGNCCSNSNENYQNRSQSVINSQQNINDQPNQIQNLNNFKYKFQEPLVCLFKKPEKETKIFLQKLDIERLGLGKSKFQYLQERLLGYFFICNGCSKQFQYGEIERYICLNCFPGPAIPTLPKNPYVWLDLCQKCMDQVSQDNDNAQKKLHNYNAMTKTHSPNHIMVRVLYFYDYYNY